MDLYQIAESRRFLGREFLVWVWFESELFEGELTATGQDPFELHLEKQITLEAGQKDKETSVLKGMQPSHTPEAREALRQGKTPTRARIRINRAEQEFTFSLSTDALSLSGVKIPALLKEEGDEPFYERIGLIEDLEALIEALYADFLALRVSTSWPKSVHPLMMRWIAGETDLDVEADRQVRDAAIHSGRQRREARRLRSAAE
ncbi:MAG: hypothetical protein U0165_17790 [Polyangiaceae bacterium]